MPNQIHINQHSKLLPIFMLIKMLAITYRNPIIVYGLFRFQHQIYINFWLLFYYKISTTFKIFWIFLTMTNRFSASTTSNFNSEKQKNVL